ncbi:hypothetical protein ABEB36_007093 [Hypothenemus hampei]|uniref:Signal recognition particle receptor subunit beta n=1 Tax=Hypothenemus hampei TaxID=57062 RepID=A0ABD1ESR5_HYPHA
MDSDANTGPIIVALILIFVTIIIFFLKRIFSRSKRHVLLTGLNEAGKTVIFSQLLYNRVVTTYTSSQENIGTYGIDGKEIILVDLPGFHGIRTQFFEKYKNQTKAIVFVIDSITFTDNVRDVANVLFNILVDPVVIKSRPHILILCNKQDRTTAKGAKVVQSVLEKEMNTLRNTQLNQPKQLESKDNNFMDKLGDSNKSFSFSHLPYKVEFANSVATCKTGDVNLDELKKWFKNVIN